MSPKHKIPETCFRCHFTKDVCPCATLNPAQSETPVVLVLHHKEATRRQSTGPLALSVLSNITCQLSGRRDAPLDLSELHAQGRRVLVLCAAEDARLLTPLLLREDDRPILLVVPDGNLRQATRIARRVPGLANAEKVTLPKLPMAEVGGAFSPIGRTTYEAMAHALGVIESAALEENLLEARAKVARLTGKSRARSKSQLPGESHALSLSANSPKLRVLYQDAHLVVVNKPAGMPVHRGWATSEKPVVQVLREQLQHLVFPVHRLDQATSGALLLALSPEVARDLQNAFSDQNVHKRYLALCRGHKVQAVSLDHPLASTNGERKPALTHFRLLGAFERYGLYEAIPVTGRTHQIRKHLKHLSHPIIGDVRYGKGEHNRHFRAHYGLQRLALHCAQLRFTHPRTGASLCVQAPIEGELFSTLEALGLCALASAEPSGGDL